jgi:signal transduction histidine kinase/CheY-like chemotaxis protein
MLETTTTATNRRRRSLQHRIAFVCACFLAAAVLAFGATVYWIERASLARSTVANLETLAQMTATNIADSIESDNREHVVRFVERLLSLPDIEAVVVRDAQYRRIAAAGRIDALPPACASGPLDSGYVGCVTMPCADPASGTRLFSVAILQNGHATQIRLWQSLLACVGAGLAAIAALLVGMRAMLRRQFAPLAGLLEAITQVRRSRDWRTRVAAQRDDEVGDLVHSYNGLLDAVQQRDDQLAQNAAQLEEQVRIRTLELRHALVQAEQATRAKSAFLANMSHEIRTPLNAVLGMTDLAMETTNPAEQAEYLSIVRSAGTNLLSVLNDILDLSKIESDKLSIQRVITELESVVLESIRPLTAKVQSKDLELHLITSPKLATAYELDDVRVRQIVTNLVGNAIKFTERGHVIVRLDLLGERDGIDTIEISVSDTGVGIQPDRLAAIFTPFTQADNTITRRFSGTGLGLTICDHLARLMGGRITVESTFGQGSTFRVELPMRRRGADGTAAVPELTGRDIFLYTLRAPLRESMQSIVGRLSTSLHCSGNWHELALHLDTVAKNERSLLALVERDPDVDELIAGRLPLGRNGRRPVLLLTSYQDLAATMQRCADRAYSGYLLKPVGMREFSVQATATASERTRGPQRPTAPQQNLRVLVAEDNLVNQRLVQKLLEREGHVPTLVGNGRTCVEVFAAQSIDLVLMDMQMPEMDGLQATKRIRELEAGRGQRVPIVALTANAGSEDRVACLASGMDDVLTKPVSVPKLQAMLRRYAATAAQQPAAR